MTRSYPLGQQRPSRPERRVERWPLKVLANSGDLVDKPSRIVLHRPETELPVEARCLIVYGVNDDQPA